MIRYRRDAGYVWPTAEQELLLRAALLPGNACLEAWDQWKARVDFDTADAGTRELLPQVFVNLRAHGADDPLMGRLGGLYRLTWYKNQLAFDLLVKLIGTFDAAGISILLVNGAALVARYYPDLGRRAVGALEILVRDQHADPALHLLERLGWRPASSRTSGVFETLSLLQPLRFVDAQGNQLVLRAAIEHPSCKWLGDPWTDAVSAQWKGSPITILRPAAALIGICADGPVWKANPSSLWPADLAALLAAEPELDWAEVVKRAEAVQIVLRVRKALDYVRSALGLDVPEAVIQALERVPVAYTERFRDHVATNPPTVPGALLSQYDRYARVEECAGVPVSAKGFARYLQAAWGAAHLWQVPYYGAIKAVRHWRGHKMKALSTDAQDVDVHDSDGLSNQVRG